MHRFFELVIIGGGPAGLAPLLAAHKIGSLDPLLAAGVAVIEAGEEIGKGQIGDYAIRSDSGGRAFVDCLDCDSKTAISAMKFHPLAEAMRAAGDRAVPLLEVGRLMAILGEAVRQTLEDHPNCAVLTGSRAISARQDETGWRVTLRDRESGVERVIRARQMIVATGAEQPAERMRTEMVGGHPLAGLAGDRLLQSGAVLRQGGLQAVQAMLAGKAQPKLAIIGGSTSAAAVAHLVLSKLPAPIFGAGAITLLHRRPLRVYYPDRASALADHYLEWTEQDVCQVSGRVFRFAGFRLDARELIMRARGVGGRPAETRLALHQLTEDDAEAARILRQADVVIAAMGYRPRALPFFDRQGQPIALKSNTGIAKPMVDGQCRVLDATGVALPNVYGIGLAAGFVPRGALGGEASFRGQANGLWLWQHDVGGLIVESILETAESQQTRPFPLAMPAQTMPPDAASSPMLAG